MRCSRHWDEQRCFETYPPRNAESTTMVPQVEPPEFTSEVFWCSRCERLPPRRVTAPSRDASCSSTLSNAWTAQLHRADPCASTPTLPAPCDTQHGDQGQRRPARTR